MFAFLKGEGLRARVLRGSFWTVSGFGMGQFLRLGSNLILTRILFPEAFGLMALVQIFLMGLGLFSDLGIRASIIQNPRSNDQSFLDTAWTIQVARGVILWLGSCLLAYPAASFYDAPMLQQLLPVAGLTAVLSGFYPTKLFTANRDLMLGRLTGVDLTAQAISILTMIAFAWATESVWSLIVGTLVGEVSKVFLYNNFLPGPANRFSWDRSAARELFSFGKWIFLSTACTFALSQGDRAVLGKYLSIGDLGVYNIGFFLASVPAMLASACSSKLIFPLYRKKPPSESMANRAQIRKTRMLLNGFLLCVDFVLMFAGIVLIETLYDERYAMAGPIVVLIACAQVPKILWINYGGALLAVGESRRFAYFLGASAALQTAFLIVGVAEFGLIGAIFAPTLAAVLTYPMISMYVARHGAWDPLHDSVLSSIAALVSILACWLHFDAILILLDP